MKNVLITGGSRGIGAEIAKEFSSKGYRVFINYKNSREKAEILAAQLGGVAVHADISNSNQVKSMISRINKEYGGIDILINNAGFAQFSMFDSLSDDDWHKMIDTTLSGAFYCIREVLPYMIHQKSGCIINISSIWGLCGSSCEVAYSTAKAGLIGMTKALAKEVGPSGIRVNCVAPGVIDTDMNSTLTAGTINQLKEETPLGRIGTPIDIAKTVLFLAHNDSFITGQVISPNGGLVI